MVDKERNIRILLEIWQDAYIWTTSFYHYTLSLIERFTSGGARGGVDRNQVIARNELKNLKLRIQSKLEEIDLDRTYKSFFIKSVDKLLNTPEIALRGLKVPKPHMDLLGNLEMTNDNSDIIRNYAQVGINNLEVNWISFNQNYARLLMKVEQKIK